VRTIVEQAEETATRILMAHREELKKIAERLLEKETIDGEEIDALIADTEGPKEPSSEPAAV